MDDVQIGVYVVVAGFLVVAALKGVGMVTTRIARIVSDHLLDTLRDSLVVAVQTSLITEIGNQVQEAVDGRFQTMELRIGDIHHELKDNGGDSLKDAIRRIEASQSQERAERKESMQELWARLAEEGIDRRSSGSQSGDAEGSY